MEEARKTLPSQTRAQMRIAMVAMVAVRAAQKVREKTEEVRKLVPAQLQKFPVAPRIEILQVWELLVRGFLLPILYAEEFLVSEFLLPLLPAQVFLARKLLPAPKAPALLLLEPLQVSQFRPSYLLVHIPPMADSFDNGFATSD